MGKTANHLLVTFFLSWLLVTSSTCLAQVKAEDYTAFWLWSGVKSQPALQHADTLYLLQGQIIANYQGNVHFIRQGNGLIKDFHQQLWLVYRVHTLSWTDDIYNIIAHQLTRWQQAGITITGIQIDFDSATSQLAQYLSFMTTVRKNLPARYKLSVTGLLDWSKQADLTTLNGFASVVDEIVIQTYQGRTTIANYREYLNSLSRLNVPFKIGLIQDGQWQTPDYLINNPYFKGYVVFLKNPSETPPSQTYKTN